MTTSLFDSPVVIAALISTPVAFLAAILGGYMQSFLTYKREKKAFNREFNRDSYRLFLEGISGLAKAPAGSVERETFVRMSIEAKAKILLQGAPSVVRALEKYSQHSVLATEQSYEDFARLTEAMRLDLGGEVMTDFVPTLRSILFEAHP